MEKSTRYVLSAIGILTGISLLAKVTSVAARLFIGFGLVFLTAAAATVDLSKRRPKVELN